MSSSSSSKTKSYTRKHTSHDRRGRDRSERGRGGRNYGDRGRDERDRGERSYGQHGDRGGGRKRYDNSYTRRAGRHPHRNNERGMNENSRSHYGDNSRRPYGGNSHRHYDSRGRYENSHHRHNENSHHRQENSHRRHDDNSHHRRDENSRHNRSENEKSRKFHKKKDTTSFVDKRVDRDNFERDDGANRSREKENKTTNYDPSTPSAAYSQHSQSHHRPKHYTHRNSPSHRSEDRRPRHLMIMHDDEDDGHDTQKGSGAREGRHQHSNNSWNPVNQGHMPWELKPRRDVPKVFCDLDGVLTDFEEKVLEICGAQPKELQKDKMWPQLESLEDGSADGFYNMLEWMRDGKRLWEVVKRFDPTILSGCPRGDWAPPQKKKWCHRELGEHVPVITCMAKDKHVSCCEGDILIDDHVRNGQKWKRKGGIFIHHKNAYDTIKILNRLVKGGYMKHSIRSSRSLSRSPTRSSTDRSSSRGETKK